MDTSVTDHLYEDRLAKLNKIKELGIDLYPLRFEKISVSEAREKKIDNKVKVAGRIMAIRGHGGLVFMDLEDGSEKIQLAFKKDVLGDSKLIPLLDLGDFIGIEGTLFKTQAGELTILVEKMTLLSKALRPIPVTWYGLKDEEILYRKRYLDFLVNKEKRNKIMIRAKVLKFIRNYLDNKGFIEVETPMLETSSSGAAARPFKTHINAFDIDLYLRICIGELWQKRLMAGGFEKTYEIGRAFRNEGVDWQHNPDFTMMEYYWAYANYEDNMEFQEKMFGEMVKELFGDYTINYRDEKLNFKPPFPRISFREAIIKYAGIDIEKFEDRESLIEEMKKRGIAINPVAGRGRLLDDLYKELVRPHLIEPTFLINHPVELSPLAKRCPEDNRYVQRFQLLIHGLEITNNYSELNDPLDQKQRFLEQAKLVKAGDDEAMGVDWDFLEAMEYGMPPITGTGIGIDRLIALLTNSHSLREAIAFPLMKPNEK